MPPAMNTTPQRDYWIGEQTELGDAWTLRKGEKTARCFLMSHLFGWELRLVVMPDDFLRSQVCRSNDEILDTQEQWKAAMVGKGWS